MEWKKDILVTFWSICWRSIVWLEIFKKQVSKFSISKLIEKYGRKGNEAFSHNTDCRLRCNLDDYSSKSLCLLLCKWRCAFPGQSNFQVFIYISNIWKGNTKSFILPLIPLDAESGCVLHLQFLIYFLAFSHRLDELGSKR